jgi:tetratricopeptide (TPR) repeat protein
MATRSRRGRQQKPAPASAPEPQADPLRAAAGIKRDQDVIPWEVLLGIFVMVWILIVVLMAPGFKNEFSFYMARRHQSNKNLAAAVPYLQSLLKDMPTNPTVLAELGYSYLHTGKYDEAIEHYSKAQQYVGNVKPDDQGNMPALADFNQEIGAAHLRKGDVANAEKHLMAALAYNKFNKEANLLMGEIEMQRGNYLKAADYFKVIARDPGYSERVRKYYAEIETKLFGNAS